MDCKFPHKQKVFVLFSTKFWTFFRHNFCQNNDLYDSDLVVIRVDVKSYKPKDQLVEEMHHQLKKDKITHFHSFLSYLC